MKKLYCLSILLLMAFGGLNATNTDSLKMVLKKTKESSEKVTILIKIGETYVKKGDYSTALEYYKKAEALNNVDEEQKNEVLYKIANAQLRLQQYKLALNNCGKILKIGSSDKKLLAKVYGLMSNVKLSLGENNEAYELQYEALKISESINDTTGLFFSSYQLGTIYFYQNNYKLALKHYKKALKYAEMEGDERHIYSGLGAIGSTYHRVGNIEQSVIYNLKSLKLATNLDYEIGIAYAAFNVGSDYFTLEKYDTSLVFFFQGLELQRKQRDKWGQSSSLRMIGEAYRMTKNWDNSIRYSNEALKIAEEIEAAPRIMEGYETLARVYEGKGDYKMANDYLRKYQVLKDTLVNEETVEKIEAVQTSYEVLQKERALLKKTNELNKTYSYVLVGGIVILLLISYMIYSRFRSEKENNELLAEKNNQIFEQNKQLRDKNKKIQKQNIKLEQSNEELRRFAFIASHDLKEPLRTIGSYSSLLKRRYKDKLDQDANEFLDYITSGVSRMYKLLNEVLDYSKIEEDELSIETVDVNETIDYVIINLGNQIEKKKATVEKSELPMVKATHTHITQLFQNLITNGLKYNDTESPKILISCATDSNSHVFSVSDNGIGIDMIYKDKIFDMFQRLHGKDEYEGTGVGLAICKKIVSQYGGDIWMNSEQGQGTTFYFSLPKVEQ
jgi:signal transduction histidine kinase/Flp pilus assembly protein TadD